jgi:NADH-quinone oxidoreductase subunit L
MLLSLFGPAADLLDSIPRWMVLHPKWVWLTVALPLLGFVVNAKLAFWATGLRPLLPAKLADPVAGWTRRHQGTVVSLVGVGVLVLSFLVSVMVFLGFQFMQDPGAYVVTLWSWLPVGQLQVDLALQVDQLSLVMLLVVTGVGSIIHLFSVGYMREDPGYARYFAYLNLFVAFMLVLVLGSSFPVMFIGWEGVGLCSYLLIGFWFEDKANADAGKKAFLVNRIGDFGFLIAMFLIWSTVGALDYETALQRLPGAVPVGGAMVTAITLFLFLGATGKSAQIPLYVWLPDAMAGPTPVSALIHAATMVTAGVYLVARTGVLFAMAPLSSTIVAGIGALTALFAATMALRQYDIKKVLAYSTISQLGYMFLGVGTGAFAAGIFHLITHAFFKALLFLGSGSVIYAMHRAYHQVHAHDDAQDMRNMGGLRTAMPWTWTLMWIATIAISGMALSGLFSKDEILAYTFGRGHDNPIYYVYYAIGMVTAALTAFYMARLMAMTFHGTNRTREAARSHLGEAPWIMTGPLVVLGLLTIVGGAINWPTWAGGHHWLEEWLQPVMAQAYFYFRPELPHGTTEYVLIAVAILVAMVGLVAGYRMTLRQTIVAAEDAPEEEGLWRVLYHKYYVDELYDAAVVRPLMAFSERFLWKSVDSRVVDGGFVNGSAGLSRVIGLIGSRLQTGQLGFYVLVFVIGAVFILRAVVR